MRKFIYLPPARHLQWSDSKRFWKRVDFDGGLAYEDDPLVDVSRVKGECWRWTGAPNSKGYGFFGFKGSSGQVHRLSYLDHGLEIPEGMVIDHLCRNTMCVNPNHLEAVTAGENVRRGRIPIANRPERSDSDGVALCVEGHRLTEENAYYSPVSPGTAVCRKCRSLTKSMARERKRLARDMALAAN